MAKGKDGNDGGKRRDYEVGHGKPPKHTQFVPGQSGFAGRKHKKVEPHDEMITRILNEVVEVGGQKMTKLALAVHQALNQTIKSGKARDLKILLELLEKYGVMTKVDQIAEARAAADETMHKISQIMFRLDNIDPQVMADKARADMEEAEIVMGCNHCGPIMRARWKTPEYKSRLKQGVPSDLHREMTDKERNRKWIEIWENMPRDAK